MTSKVGHFQWVEATTCLHTYSNPLPVPFAHTSVDSNVCRRYAVSSIHCWRTHMVVLSSNLHVLVAGMCALANVCVYVSTTSTPRLLFHGPSKYNQKSSHTRFSARWSNRDYAQGNRATNHTSERASAQCCVVCRLSQKRAAQRWAKER